MTTLPDGLPFGPETISWQVSTEPSIFVFGAGRALLLQVLHPLVAAGVEDHSDYRADPWGRLYRTLDTTLKLAFGDELTATRRAGALRRRHARVTGVSPDGVSYRALDPALLLWVWATLIDTAVLVYERAVHRLTTGDRERFYHEQILMAYACGIPDGGCPDSWEDFQRYVATVIDTDLRVTPTALAVAASVTRPALPWPLSRVAGAAVAVPAATLLPARFASELGLQPDGAAPRIMRASFAVARAGAAVIPSRVRRLPLAPFIGVRTHGSGRSVPAK